MKHSPLPWELNEPIMGNDRTFFCRTPINKNPKYIGRIYGEGVFSAMKDNVMRDCDAHFILHCCNNFEWLLDLVKQAHASLYAGDGGTTDISPELAMALETAVESHGEKPEETS